MVYIVKSIVYYVQYNMYAVQCKVYALMESEGQNSSKTNFPEIPVYPELYTVQSLYTCTLSTEHCV